jgi:cation diffusion facilitator family transporter
MAPFHKTNFSRIRFVLIFVLALNWAVAAAKIILGLFTKCQSMTADGFHSLSDGASNIIGLIGITLAGRPTDEDHPYGHKKYETFFSLGIAALLFVVAISLVHGVLERIRNPVVPRVDAYSFAVMIITMLINIGVMRYEYRRGRELSSDILVADSMHTKADIFTSLSVIAALVTIKSGYPLIDPIVTLIISVFIGFTGYEIIKDASRILCDTVAVEDINRITTVVLGVKGVKTCHKIRTRGRPDDICVDLHVQVDPDMHIDQAHKISYDIEDVIRKAMPEVTDVLVHMEPKGRPGPKRK